MSGTKPKKWVIRVALGTIAIGMIIVLLIAALGATMSYYTMTIYDKNNTNANNAKTIDQLNATIVEQTNKISSLNANITNLTTENNQLQVWLNGNETALHQFETWLKGNVSSYETQTSLLNSQINQLQTWLNGNITSYTSQINSLNGNVTSLQKQMADLEARLLGLWNVNNIQFDLDDPEHFTVNVTNAPVSLGEINITRVDLNQNITSMNSAAIAPASSSIVVCGFNWTMFVGANVTVTVHACAYGQNETTISQALVLPCFKVTNASFSNFPTGNPYVNITIFNSQYSPINASITQISVTANNLTKLIDGTVAVPSISTSGYLLPIGNKVTFVCPWNWGLYSGQNVTFTVQLAQGKSVSVTFKVE
jgi:chaperonin cofactor prefoldin